MRISKALAWTAIPALDGGYALLGGGIFLAQLEVPMRIFPLRSARPQDPGPDEFEFPLPVADPLVRPMHRECVLKGCSYRSRFLFGAGWALAVLFLLTTITMALYSAQSQEALLRENAFLNKQINARREQSVTRPSAPAPADGGSVAASAPPSPPKAAPQFRTSRPQKNVKVLPSVPESEKWWNSP